jgi:hypothetical protein
VLGKFGDLDLVSEIIAEGQELLEWFMNHHARDDRELCCQQDQLQDAGGEVGDQAEHFR